MFLKFSQIPKENICGGDTFLKSCNPEDSVKKRLQHRCFPVKFAKYLRTTILTEQLQWLLLTFSSYFQRIPERKSVRLLAINTRSSWKKVFAVAKISQIKCYHFSIVKLKGVSLTQMSNIIKKLFYCLVQTSSEMLSFLHRQGCCWKCEFNTDFKIEWKVNHQMESN